VRDLCSRFWGSSLRGFAKEGLSAEVAIAELTEVWGPPTVSSLEGVLFEVP